MYYFKEDLHLSDFLLISRPQKFNLFLEKLMKFISLKQTADESYYTRSRSRN